MNTSPGALYIPDPMDCRTCNLCMGFCPTYKIHQVFEQSPQGRLRLMDRVLNQGQSLTAREIESLDDCVGCRACEKVCPSKMRFSMLLRKTQRSLPELPKPMLLRMLMWLARHREWLRRGIALLRVYQISGLQSLLQRSGMLRLTGTERLHQLFPSIPPYRALDAFYPAAIERRGAVGLFTGCLTDAVNNPVLHAAVKLLTRLGYDVHVPRQQGCCGAIHAHNDDKATADELAEINLQAFDGLDVESIIYCASGCGSTLMHYKRRQLTDKVKQKVPMFEKRLQEINQFLADIEWLDQVTFKPCNEPVLVHEPCSQRFPVGSSDCTYDILRRIPQIQLLPLADNAICCGAGGSYMLTHPDMSRDIRGLKINHLSTSSARILLTSNIGCSMHLSSGIEQAGLGLSVCHPVELLARQII